MKLVAKPRYAGHSWPSAERRSSNSVGGIRMSSTSSVIAIAKTPSLKASVRPVSQRSRMGASSTPGGCVLRGLVRGRRLHGTDVFGLRGLAFLLLRDAQVEVQVGGRDRRVRQDDRVDDARDEVDEVERGVRDEEQQEIGRAHV